jgi:hypothetical protein
MEHSNGKLFPVRLLSIPPGLLEAEGSLPAQYNGMIKHVIYHLMTIYINLVT